MTFVIADTAAIQFTIAQARLEGRRLPQFEWFGRLDVIMVIDEECLVRFAFAFSEDNGRARRFHDLNFKTAGLEHFSHQCRAFFQSQVLRAYTRLSNETRKFLKA